MTSDKLVYLTVNSYVEAPENASWLITFEVSHQVADESEQRNFATMRTLKFRNSIWGLASTARWRRTDNIASDPPRSPGTRARHMAKSECCAPRDHHFAQPPSGAASMDIWIAALPGRL